MANYYNHPAPRPRKYPPVDPSGVSTPYSTSKDVFYTCLAYPTDTAPFTGVGQLGLKGLGNVAGRHG